MLTERVWYGQDDPLVDCGDPSSDCSGLDTDGSWSDVIPLLQVRGYSEMTEMTVLTNCYGCPFLSLES